MIKFQCFICKHFKGLLTCEAYPERIPSEILEFFDHRKHFEGDNGIRYEPMEEFVNEFPEDENKLEKGGPGSGNFDHAGRPGKVGGSQPNKTNLDPATYDTQSYDTHEFDSEFSKEIKRIKGDTKVEFEPIDPSWSNENITKLSNNISEYVSQLQDYFDARTYHKFEGIMTLFLNYGILYDKCSAQDFQDKAKYLTDILMYQEERSWERQLSDHGVRHIWSNATRVIDILKSMDSTNYYNPTEEDLYLSVLTMIVHDLGYTTKIARESIPGTRLHKKLSAKIFEDKKEEFLKIIPEEQFNKVKELILHHDDTIIDWENAPVQTAVSLSDNLSLYQEDKLPALFRFVDNGIDILKSMAEHRKNNDTEGFEKDKKTIFEAIDNTMLAPYIKIKLKKAAKEIGSYTPDRNLPILVGEVKDLDFNSDGYLKVKVTRNDFQQKLLGLIDIGQDQIMKLAKDYGVTDGELISKLIPVYKDGKKVLEIDIED